MNIPADKQESTGTRNAVCPVVDARQIRSVLADADYTVARYGRGYEHLKGRSGRDFANIEFALRYLPVAHDGERHIYLRNLASKQLQSTSEALKNGRQRYSDLAAEVFLTRRKFDLVADIAEPIVAAMVKDLSGVEVKVSPSLIFDPSASLRKRRLLDQEIGRITAEMRKALPDADDDQIGTNLMFAVLANDASQGLLLANLAKILTDNAGRAFSQIAWPVLPIETGIRFIERIASCPVQHGRHALAAGTVLRSDMSALTRDGDAATLFGIGRHMCLGRGFFLAFWRDLMTTLAQLPIRVVKVESGPTLNRVFAIPQYVFVEVSE